MDHHPLAASLLSRPSFDVIAWVDPVCDAGFPCDSDEALVVLCPVLGPSATMILHRLARYASAGPTTLGARRVRLDVRAFHERVDQPRREGDRPTRSVRIRHDRLVLAGRAHSRSVAAPAVGCVAAGVPP